MPLLLCRKYKIEDKVLGKGACSVVRSCVPIPPYCPPNVLVPIFGPDGLPLPATTHPPRRITQFAVKVIVKKAWIAFCHGNPKVAKETIAKEISAMRRIPPHPNIIVFVESIETPSTYYLFFERAGKGDVCDKLLHAPQQRLPEDVVQQYARDMVFAVLHCHLNGVAHHDIKPENFLIGRDGSLKLTDFGFAIIESPADPKLASYAAALRNELCPTSSPRKAGSRSPLNNSASTASKVSAHKEEAKIACRTPHKAIPASVAPTPTPTKRCKQAANVNACADELCTTHYAAPEIWELSKARRKCYDAYSADCFALGVTLFVMLTGKYPFAHDNFDEPLTALHWVSRKVAHFVTRLLTKEARNRMKLVEALEHPWLQVAPRRPEGLSPNQVLKRTNTSIPVRAAQGIGTASHQAMLPLVVDFPKLLKGENDIAEESLLGSRLGRCDSDPVILAAAPKSKHPVPCAVAHAPPADASAASHATSCAPRVHENAEACEAAPQKAQPSMQKAEPSPGKAEPSSCHCALM